MAFDHEKARILREAANEYLSHKSILLEPEQPRLTEDVDSRLKQLKKVMDSNIVTIHRDQGAKLREKLTKVYEPLYSECPSDLMIATGVITAFEQLHPDIDKLAEVGEIHRLTMEASRNWGDDFKLPALLNLHGFLYGLTYIIEKFPAE